MDKNYNAQVYLPSGIRGKIAEYPRQTKRVVVTIFGYSFSFDGFVLSIFLISKKFYAAKTVHSIDCCIVHS